MSQIWGNLGALTWQMVAMWIIGGVMIYLAICKEMEPTLLLPMGFGCILCNLPNSGGGGSAGNPVSGGRGERAFPAAAVYRHRRDDRFRPAAGQSEAAALRRGGAVRHLLHAVDGEPVRL